MDIEKIRVDLVELNNHARTIDNKTVTRLAESIKQIGLRTPITVRRRKVLRYGDGVDGYEVVSGQHRLEAVKMLGLKEIESFVTEDDATACRLWEIAENLHRAELSQLERDKLINEWAMLVGEKPVLAQVAPKPQGGRPSSGVREAARQLGIDRDDVRRATKVASLSEEAQEVARETGQDNNRTALLEAADKPAEEQADYLRQRAEITQRRKEERKVPPKPKPTEEVEDKAAAQIIQAWNKAGKKSRLKAMEILWADWKDLEEFIVP